MTMKLKSTCGSLVLTTSAMLAACGGGSDDAGSPDPTSPPVSPAASLTLSGTAAVGALITGQTVNVRCATGNGSATTGSDGTYTVTIPSGAWPCAAQVTSAAGQVLTTVATASGTSAVAHLTPASHLVVAALVGGDPAAWFQAYSATSATAITAATIGTAQAQVVATLRAAGVDFGAVGDLLAAAYTTTYDNLLLTFGQRLAASGTTLASLASTVATVASTPSAVSVASELLLQPAAANCNALRTATYRLLTPSGSAALSAQTSLLTVDATTLRVGHANGTTGTWVANGTCRFSEQTGTYAADVTVSPAGVIVARYTGDGTTYRVMLGFPEQTHTLAELAGTTNTIGLQRVATGVYAPYGGIATFDAAGRLTAATNCQNTATWAIDTCVTVPSTFLAGVVPLAVDPAGGFDSTDPNTGAVVGRFFAFRAGSGDLMVASVNTSGDLGLSAPIKAVVLPVAGRVTSNWDFDIGPSMLSSAAIYQNVNTANIVDTTAQSYTRTQSTIGTNRSHPETIVVNSPRTGYVARAQATVVDSTGASITINTMAAMTMPGMGLGVAVLYNTSGGRWFEPYVQAP